MLFLTLNSLIYFFSFLFIYYILELNMLSKCSQIIEKQAIATTTKSSFFLDPHHHHYYYSHHECYYPSSSPFIFEVLKESRGHILQKRKKMQKRNHYASSSVAIRCAYVLPHAYILIKVIHIYSCWIVFWGFLFGTFHLYKHLQKI